MVDTLAQQKHLERNTTKYTMHSMLDPWVVEIGWYGWC